MDVQYQRSTRQTMAVCLWQPYYLNYGRHVVRLHRRRRRRRRRAYAPTSNTACQDNHEKINSWVSFAFLYVFEYGAPLGGPLGRRSSATNTRHVCQVK